MEMKIYINKLGHLTKMAVKPIYFKNLKKASVLEPLEGWPWNLVYSIWCSSTTKIVEMMTSGWFWSFLYGKDNYG